MTKKDVVRVWTLYNKKFVDYRESLTNFDTYFSIEYVGFPVNCYRVWFKVNSLMPGFAGFYLPRQLKNRAKENIRRLAQLSFLYEQYTVQEWDLKQYEEVRHSNPYTETQCGNLLSGFDQRLVDLFNHLVTVITDSRFYGKIQQRCVVVVKLGLKSLLKSPCISDREYIMQQIDHQANHRRQKWNRHEHALLPTGSGTIGAQTSTSDKSGYKYLTTYQINNPFGRN